MERTGVSNGEVLLEVDDVYTNYTLRGSFLQRVFGREKSVVRAVDGVSLEVRRGEVLGLVGESGSGKTTLGKTILGLTPASSGSIRLHAREIRGLSESDLRPLRRQMQMVFQDPHASLNPAMDLLTAIGHPLVIHGITKDRRAIRAAVGDALERVGLVPTELFMSKYPSDLSGGQKQRAVMARALILGPDLIVADEPVSMLDMSVRAKILELLISLKDELGLTYIYITHDLATAKFLCDRIAIMYLGRIVEAGPTAAIFSDPKHPYTVSLLEAVPDPDPSRPAPPRLPRGEIPDAVTPPLGCSFHPRCPRAFEPCGWESRDLRDLIEARWAGMDESGFESERAIVGDLGAMEEASAVARVPAGRGRSGADVLEFLGRIRDDDRAEPLWSGVRSMSAAADHAIVEFREAVDPKLRPHRKIEVACHLYDEGLKRAGSHPEATSR